MHKPELSEQTSTSCYCCHATICTTLLHIHQLQLHFSCSCEASSRPTPRRSVGAASSGKGELVEMAAVWGLTCKHSQA